jgi:hypothetical protein
LSQARYRERLSGVTLALLVQAGMVTIFALSFYQVPSPRRLAHEMIWLLRSLPQSPTPQTIDARPQPQPWFAPDIFGVQIPAIRPPSILAPPGDLMGLNRRLFDCTPEMIGLLPPEQRIKCPFFATAPAHDDSDLLNAPSHIIDETYWQEQWRRANITFGICAGGSVVGCLIEQDRAERYRQSDIDRQIARERAGRSHYNWQSLDRARAIRGPGPSSSGNIGLPQR